MLGSKSGSKPAVNLIFSRRRSDKNDQYLASRVTSLPVPPKFWKTLQLSD